MAVHMALSRIMIRETNDLHYVELREVDGDRTFAILIGLPEAAAIERRLMGHQPPRPQTHELLAAVIGSLGGQLEKIVINDLHDQTFFAQLHIRQNGELIEIDSRPSDAIALGAESDVPIYVAEHVLEEAGQPD